MNAEQRIRKAMEAFMMKDEVNASQVFKGWAYNYVQRYGWHYIKFGGTPTYMGDNLAEALQFCENLAEARREMYR